ncbi:MAG: DUF6913 domain-containing protein [Salibacteraceae bacterium]
MIWRLREWFGRMAFDKAVKGFESSPNFNFNSVKKIGLLVNYSNLPELNIKKVENLLSQKFNASVEVVSFCENNKELEAFTGSKQIKLIGKKDLNFNLTLKANNEFDYDLLIDLTPEPELVLQILLLNLKPQIRMGVQQPHNKEWLDFMIQSPEKIDFVFVVKQLIHYLNMINTNNNAA